LTSEASLDLVWQNPYIKGLSDPKGTLGYKVQSNVAGQTITQVDVTINYVFAFEMSDLLPLGTGGTSGLQLWLEDGTTIDTFQSTEDTFLPLSAIGVAAHGTDPITGREFWRISCILATPLNVNTAEQTIYAVFKTSSTIANGDQFQVAIKDPPNHIHFSNPVDVSGLPPFFATTLHGDISSPASFVDIAAANASAWPQNLHYIASDVGGSGVDYVTLWYRYRGWSNGVWGSTGPWTEGPSLAGDTGTFSFDGSAYGLGDGVYHFYSQAFDRAGNHERPPTSATAPDKTMNFDSTGPIVASATIDMDPAIDGTRTVTVVFQDQSALDTAHLDAAGTSTALTATQLTDASANWTPGAFVGGRVNPNTAQNQTFIITNNSATTLTVVGDMTASGLATAGDPYRILSPAVSVTGATTSPYTVMKTSYNAGTKTWVGTFALNDDNEEVRAYIAVSGAKDALGNIMTPNNRAGSFKIDTVNPTLIRIDWTDVDGNGEFSAGDRLHFVFSERMKEGTITDANVETTLPLGGHTYGTNPHVDWADPEDVTAIVILGSGTNIDDGDTVNPSNTVTDLAGNPDATAAPGPAIDDNRGPRLESIGWTDTDGNGYITQTDIFDFNFSEDMTIGDITLANVDTQLPLTATGGGATATTYDATNVAWTGLKQVSVTLGATNDIAFGNTGGTIRVTPAATVRDNSVPPNGAQAVARNIVDNIAPTLAATMTTINSAGGEWTDANSNGYYDAGDTVVITFTEPMRTGSITPGNINSRLSLSDGGSWGTTPGVAWSGDRTQVTITLVGNSFIRDGMTFNPSNGVRDSKGNADNTTDDATFEDDIPPNRVMDVTILYNDIDGSAGLGNNGAGPTAASYGDVIILTFSEPMNTARIPADNSTGGIDAALVLSGGGSWGSEATATWDATGRTVTITLGATGLDMNIGTTTITPLATAAGVVDLAGNPYAGGAVFTVGDNVNPFLETITWRDDTGDGILNADRNTEHCDVLIFSFFEAMDPNTITNANVNARLPITGGGSYGSVTEHMHVLWISDYDCLVTLGYDETIEVNNTVNPAPGVTDVAGNPDATPAAVVIDFCAIGVVVGDMDGDGDIDQGDRITYTFSNAIKQSTITNPDLDLPLTPGATYGTGATFDFPAANQVRVTLGAGETITDNHMLNPADTVLDVADRPDRTNAVVGPVIRDIFAPRLALAFPVANGEGQGPLFDCQYDLGEACKTSGAGRVTMTFTRTGGSADGNSPHTVTALLTGNKGTNTPPINGSDLNNDGNTTTTDHLVDAAVYDVSLDARDLYNNVGATQTNTNWVYYTWTELRVVAPTQVTQNEPFNTVITARNNTGAIATDANFTVNLSADKLGVTFPAGDNHFLKHGKLTVPVVVSEVYGADNPLHISAYEWWAQGEYREFRHGTSGDIIVNAPTIGAPMNVAGWDDANDQGGRVVIRWDKSINDQFAGIGRAVPAATPVTGQPGRPDGYDVLLYTSGNYTGAGVETYTVAVDAGGATYGWTSIGDGSGSGLTPPTTFTSIGTLGLEIAFSAAPSGGEQWTIRCTPAYSGGGNAVTEYRVLRGDDNDGDGQADEYHFVASQKPDADAVPSTDVDTYAQDGPGDGVLGVYYVVAYSGTENSPMSTPLAESLKPQIWSDFGASGAKVGDIFIPEELSAASPAHSALSNPAEAMSVDNISPDPVTDLTVEIINSDLRFTWTAITEGQGIPERQPVKYNIYRATNEAYFTPGPENLHVSEHYSSETTVTYIDSDSVGDVNNNYFYVVKAFDGTNESSISNRVGEFDVPLKTTATTDWNLVTAPVGGVEITDASELLAAIPNASSVSNWNAIRQKYETYVPATGFNNFPVARGFPYLASITADGVWSVAGSLTTPRFELVVTETTDWNLITVPLNRTDIENAEQLLAAIPNASSVSNWNAERQKYETYVPATGFNNFPVKVGRAYLVSVGQSGVWPGETSGSTAAAPAKAKNPRLTLKPVILK
jgi:hypothetical protein